MRGSHYVSHRKINVRNALEVAGLFFELTLSANDIQDKIIEMLKTIRRSNDDVAIYLSEDLGSDG